FSYPHNSQVWFTEEADDSHELTLRVDNHTVNVALHRHESRTSVRHRGRTASCPSRPRTDPGVPFSSTGLFRNTRFRVRHRQRKTGAVIQHGFGGGYEGVARGHAAANRRSPRA